MLLACAAGVAASRELDLVLDAVVPRIGWKAGYALLGYGAYRAYRGRRRLRAQAREFFATRAFGMTWGAFMVAVPVAQLVGHGPFLELAMGDDYAWGYKHMLEETLETAGYLLLLFAAIEAHFQLAPARARPPVVRAAEARSAATAAWLADASARAEAFEAVRPPPARSTLRERPPPG